MKLDLSTLLLLSVPALACSAVPAAAQIHTTQSHSGSAIHLATIDPGPQPQSRLVEAPAPPVASFTVTCETVQGVASPVRVGMTGTPPLSAPRFEFRNVQTGAVAVPTPVPGAADPMGRPTLYYMKGLAAGTYDVTASWPNLADGPRYSYPGLFVPPFHSTNGRGTGCAF